MSYVKMCCAACTGKTNFPTILLVNNKNLTNSNDAFITIERLCHFDRHYLKEVSKVMKTDPLAELRLLLLLINYAKENSWLINTASNWTPVHHELILSAELDITILPTLNRLIIQELQRMNNNDDRGSVFRLMKSGNLECESLRYNCFHSLFNNTEDQKFCLTLNASEFFKLSSIYHLDS